MSDSKRPSETPKYRGCLIAVGVVAALFLLVVVGAGVAAWRYSKTDDGQQKLEWATAWYDAAASDEARALKNSLGCQALMFPVEDATHIDARVERFAASLPSPPAHVVACVELKGQPLSLTCRQLGKAWRDATGLNEAVIAWVALRSGKQCLEVAVP